MDEEKEGKNEDLNNEKEKKVYLSPKEVITFAFGIIEEKAWISLGLIKDTDGEFHKSKEDARLLIDISAKMLDAMEGKFDEAEIKEMKNQLSTLQLNFVNQFKSTHE